MCYIYIYIYIWNEHKLYAHPKCTYMVAIIQINYIHMQSAYVW